MKWLLSLVLITSSIIGAYMTQQGPVWRRTINENTTPLALSANAERTMAESSTESSLCNMGENENMTTETTMSQVLFDFESVETSGSWMIVNDGVMGGLSESGIRLSENGTALFEGVVSLENFGGFASVRTTSFDSLENTSAVLLRVLGDGRTYKLRLRPNAYLDGPAYEAEFETVAGEWTIVEIPYTALKATFRGRLVRTAPELTGADVEQIGIMIADKTEGGFRLEIDWIKAISQ